MIRLILRIYSFTCNQPLQYKLHYFFIFIFLNPEIFGLFFRGILPYLAGISLIKRNLFILKHGNEFPCPDGGIRNCKTRKGDSKYERKNTEKDSGTRFAWVFV